MSEWPFIEASRCSTVQKGRDDDAERSKHKLSFVIGLPFSLAGDKNVKSNLPQKVHLSEERRQQRPTDVEGPLVPVSDINLCCSGRPEDPLSLQSGLASVGDTGV